MLVLSCEQFTYVFNKLTGLFDKMTFANEPLLDQPMGFNVCVPQRTMIAS